MNKNFKRNQGIFFKLITLVNIILMGIATGVLLGSFFRLSYLRYNKPTIRSPNKNKELLFKKENNEILKLTKSWESIYKDYQDLKLSAYVLFTSNNSFLKLNSRDILPAASSLKVPILAISLIEIQEGKFSLNDEIQLDKESISSGAGWISTKNIGTSFTVNELIKEMIKANDNSAANLLINKIGINYLNEKLKIIGLDSTKFSKNFPDLQGENISNSEDLVKLFQLIEMENLLSPKYKMMFYEILRLSSSNDFISEGLLRSLQKNIKSNNFEMELKKFGVEVFNRSGDIGISYSDVGLIKMSDKTTAIAAFIVSGPFNDKRSPELIKKLSEVITRYQNLENSY